MPKQFGSFVILGGMRTGSNFLEDSLNQFSGLHCYGEVFNPHFVGHAKQNSLFDVSLEERESDPIALLRLMQAKTDGLPGFRLFHDHDPRVFKHCLSDKTCAKIVLFRNPVETYVSREIARQTNQWRLGDMKNAKSARIVFNSAEFEKHIGERQEFYSIIRRELQIDGQSAYYIGYEDIPDAKIISGLVRYLGIDPNGKKPTPKTKKQNPAPLSEKVENHAEMLSALASADYFSLSSEPNFEPRRGPAVPSFLASPRVPLIFMPIPAGPTESVLNWLRNFDRTGEDELLGEFTQKSLRQWKRRHKGHLSFSVVRHPVTRLHNAFLTHVARPGPKEYTRIKDVLIKNYGLPKGLGRDDFLLDSVQHREAFLKFAKFVEGNLNGQTSVRVDGAWASQFQVLSGMSNFMMPDHIFREAELEQGLAFLATAAGQKPPQFSESSAADTGLLGQIYNNEIEVAVRSAYQRDYMMFGYGPWRQG